MSAAKKANRKRKHSEKFAENGKIRKVDGREASQKFENGEDGSDNENDHQIGKVVEEEIEDVEEELKTTGSFNMKKFREKLKSGDFITELRHFLQEAASNPTLVAKYVNVGGKPLELIEALERIDKTQLFHVSYLFQVTQLVLIEILSNSTQFTQAAIQSCSFFLNKHRSCVESLLNSRTTSHRKAVLKLLTAIVALEPSFGRDILSTINVVFNPETLERFTHHMRPDANAAAGDETVRTCYIHFVMAYLIEGNVMLVKNILDRSELIMLVLAGLVYDSQETVSLVLGTLLKFVLKTEHVSKTKKVQVFNADIVTKLVALFQWKGPAYFAATFGKKSKEMIKLVGENDLKLVSTAVQEFLDVLLCSRKHGVAFQSLGLRLLKKNHTQKVFLTTVKQPWRNAYTADLAIGVLKACPELSKVALKNYNYFLNPKNKPEYIQTAEWLAKLIDAMTPSVLRSGAANINVSEMVHLIQAICMGPEILYKLGSDSKIRNDSLDIRYASTRLLYVMFKQCNAYLFAIGKWGIYSEYDMRKIKFDMINHIFACAPPVEKILLSLHVTLMNPSAEMFQHLESTLDLLLIIAKSIPSFIEASGSVMNYMKILQPIYEMNREHELSTRIELKAVQLILTLEPKALSVKTPLFKQVIDSFINVFNFGTPTERSEAQALLRNVFRNTGFFENGILEIDLWLESLKFVEKDALVEVKRFLVNALTTFNPNKVPKSQADDGVNNVKNIDELFFNIDNGLTLTGFMDIPTLSSFFVHSVTQLTEESGESVQGYLNHVGFLLFHYLPQPAAIQSLMKDMKHPYSKYMKNWTVSGKRGKLTDHQLNILVPFYDALLSGDKSFADVFRSDGSGVLLRIGGVETEVDADLKNEARVMVLVYMTMFVVVQLNEQNVYDEKLNGHCTSYMKALIEILHQLNDESKQETKGGFEVETVDNSFVASLKYIFESRFYFLSNFNVWQNASITKLIVELTKHVSELNKDVVDDILHHYRTKITNQIEQVVIQAKDTDSFAPPANSSDVLEILEAFSLKHDHLVTIIDSVQKLPATAFSTFSPIGHTFYDIVGFALRRVANLKEKVLPNELVANVCRIYVVAINEANDQTVNERFEDAIYSYLKAFYHSIGSVPKELFTATLKCGKPSKLTIKLASLLLERKKQFTEDFIELLPTLTSKKELIYPLLNVIANGSLKLDANLLASLYGEFRNGIMKTIEKPQKAGVIYKENIFSTLFLIEQCMPLNECLDFVKKSNKFDSAEMYQLQIVKAIHLKALATDKLEQREVVFMNFVNIFVQLFSLLLKKDTVDYHKVNGFAVIISQWLDLQKGLKIQPESYEKVTNSPLWTTISRTCLKIGINADTANDSSGILLKVFGFLCDNFYANNCENNEPAKLYEMALSHSAFIDLALQNQRSNTKTHLMYTLFVLLQKNASSIKSNHVPVFLGAYQAKLSECDQFTLAIIQKYEQCGIKMHEFKPFMFGESAASFYSLRETAAKTNLNQESPSMQVMSLIDANCSERTLTNFPIWRKLDATAQVPRISFTFHGIVGNEHMDVPNIAANRLEECVVRSEFDAELLDMSYRSQETYDDIYDPSFFVPLMSMSFAPEAFTKPLRPAQNGLLGMTFAALSCKDKALRLAAGSALQRYRTHLESTHFIDNKVWLHLFDCVQNGLGELTVEMRKTKKSRIPRVPYVSGIFLAHTINILMNPLNELYRPLSNYITLQNSFSFLDVPEFNVLFNSSDVKHVTYRHFMLGILRDGIKCGSDFTLLISHSIFKAILGFYNTPMATLETNLLILRIINVAVKIPKSNKILIEKIGLLPWLNAVVDNVEFFQFDIIDGLCSVFNSIWFSIRFDQREYDNVNDIELRLFNILLKLIPSLSTRTDCMAFAKFLNVFARLIKGNFNFITESNIDHLISCAKVHITENILNLSFVKESDEMYCENRVPYVRQLREMGVNETVLFIEVTMREIILGWLRSKKI